MTLDERKAVAQRWCLIRPESMKSSFMKLTHSHEHAGQRFANAHSRTPIINTLNLYLTLRDLSDLSGVSQTLDSRLIVRMVLESNHHSPCLLKRSLAAFPNIAPA